MPNVRMKTVVTQRLKAACPTHSRTEVDVRDVHVTSDEPVERGGGNAGLAPTELLMASLAACTNVIFHKCAKQHGVDVAALEIDVIAQLDRRGVTLQEEIEVPFPTVKLVANLTTSADDAAIEAAKTDLSKFCPVSKVIHNSGTQVEEEWIIHRP